MMMWTSQLPSIRNPPLACRKILASAHVLARKPPSILAINRNDISSPHFLHSKPPSILAFNRNIRVHNAKSQPVAPVSDAEDAANKKRWEESGNKQGSVDEWRWTLNWDQITEDIYVGSCPRSPSDIDKIVAGTGVDAIICLQCDLCHEALDIDWPVIRSRGIDLGITMTKVSVRDFDHNDQALMLPEAVKMLYVLLSMGRKVYVHCTAGINRATLTVVGYLTFVKGMHLDGAVALVKGKRSQAHPYIDCWKTVRARLLQGREEEVRALARKLAANRETAEDGVSSSDDRMDNWLTAEETLIREQFQRQMEAMLSLTSSLTDLHTSSLQQQATALTATADYLQRKKQQALIAAGPSAMAAAGFRPSVNGAPSVKGAPFGGLVGDSDSEDLDEGCAVAFEIAQEATREVEELKAAMEVVARTAETALTDPTKVGAPSKAPSEGPASNGNGNKAAARQQ